MALRAGTSKVCITPPLGIPLGGEFVRPEAAYVHDHLWARCLFLEHEGSRVALVSCDLVGLPQDVFDQVLDLLREPLGLRDHELFINCTHTHSGPDTPAIIHERLDHPYMDELPGLVARAVAEAANNLRPAVIGHGTGTVEGVCTNRRVRVKGGSVRMNWEKIPADEIESLGPTDPTLGVIRVDEPGGGPISTVAHYTCHAAIVSPFPRQISADYPGLVCRTIEQLHGGMGMFLNGAFGDINHIMAPGEYAARNKGARALPFEEVERVGRPIAAETLRVLPGIATSEATIGSASRVITVNLRKPSYTDLAEAQADVNRQRERMDAARNRGDDAEAWSALIDLTYAEHGVKLIRARRHSAEMRLSALRIGDLAIMCIPCEAFVEIGFEIKRRSRFPATWVTSITSGYTGYLPTEESFGQGGYEVRTCGWSKWARDADKAVIEASVDLLGSIP